MSDVGFTVNPLPSRQSILETWIAPQGFNARLEQAINDHAREDLKQLQSAVAAAATTDRRLAGIGALMSDGEGQLKYAAGCAGVHLKNSDPSKPATTHLATSIAELAALNGDSVDLPLAAIDTLAFPILGLAIRRNEREPALLRVRPDEILVQWGAEHSVIEIERRPTMPPVARVQTVLQTTQPLVIHGVRITSEPSFFANFVSKEKAQLHRLERQEEATLWSALSLLEAGAGPLLCELQKTGCVLVPVRAIAPNTKRISWSDRRARSTIFLGISEVFDTLDLIIHEYAHLKLCLLQDTYDLLENHSIPILSPWRSDRRTAEGHVHGLYAFFQVARNIERIFAFLPPQPRVLRRLVVWRVCIEQGLLELRRSGSELTPVGTLLIDAIAEENERGLSEFSRAPDLPWARKVVREHLAQAGRPDSRDPWFLAE